MSAPRIVMYTTSWCGFCERARRIFNEKGVPFEEVDVEAEPRNRAEMRERSGRTSVPQIFIGDHHVGGSSDLAALEKEGKLDSLLGHRPLSDSPEYKTRN